MKDSRDMGRLASGIGPSILLAESSRITRRESAFSPAGSGPECVIVFYFEGWVSALRFRVDNFGLKGFKVRIDFRFRVQSAFSPAGGRP